jgi:hypothetical protein
MADVEVVVYMGLRGQPAHEVGFAMLTGTDENMATDALNARLLRATERALKALCEEDET